MIAHLPHLNVSLNAAAGVFLVAGYRAIRRRDIDAHRRRMLGALGCSALFLASYLTYHTLGEETRYAYRDWTRPVYFAVLIPHVILATLMVPFILRGVWLAWRGRFPGHARLMRYVFPVWLYVSVTGVLVYLMLYTQPLLRGG